jgi:hypothetical protein
VRFVYDEVQEKMDTVQVRISTGWRNSTREEFDDVADSLVNGNIDGLDEPEEYGLERCQESPDWARETQGVS